MYALALLTPSARRMYWLSPTALIVLLVIVRSAFERIEITAASPSTPTMLALVMLMIMSEADLLAIAPILIAAVIV